MSVQHFSKFDSDHWSLVYRTRRELGLPAWTIEQRRLPEHPLMGKRVFDESTGKTYTVDSVHKDFYCGYFVALTMVDDSGSHAVRYIENVSSTSGVIIDAVQDFQNTCKVVG